MTEMPLPEEIVKAAIDWQLKLDAQGRTDSPELRHWLASDPRHRQAWQRLGSLGQDFSRLPDGQRKVLLDSHAPSPRLRPHGLAGIALAITCGLLLMHRQQPLPSLLADYASGTGQVREIRLEDDSRVLLGPRSWIDIDFNDGQRLVLLRQGQVFIETAKDARPFVVRSVDGSMRALGTVFTVQRDAQGSHLAVSQSAVAAQGRPSGTEVIVRAGESIALRDGELGPVRPGAKGADAWTRGMLQADDQPLEDVLRALAHYRRAPLSLDPALAGLRVSGSFSLHDTDRTLEALASALPIRVISYGGLWTRVVPSAEH
ncbi:FecR domain-containing protein [Stutzerimonas kirkiae]|uniref:Amino acid ABC transporter substrate-binding protein n=1 Tax=Stutzerimonas kirkiae TaxID=2211392 RepID=A0A4Q9RAL1_9GAMM|nr:FecR family protein [Stutzerimonas kirkiae]TBU97774.1 amino acid ABC transporter substrate-binding protein [Stutzerimonas kirkiae]TBV04875.1 amino acid ABC transporter substrate-binding protein [Stutzerimonas kirkiae]TBV12011.1 amino acid ABC transporter substrate-binding protein [Stutzerimonas kirkiae]TBV14980.1 amino acid ABC transporter substrate-binding protein [Stutzerimonas kirkiae]